MKSNLSKTLCVCVVSSLQTEQLKDLKQEFMKQEEQQREVKKNITTLEKKLEYERYLTPLFQWLSLGACLLWSSLLNHCFPHR